MQFNPIVMPEPAPFTLGTIVEVAVMSELFKVTVREPLAKRFSNPPVPAKVILPLCAFMVTADPFVEVAVLYVMEVVGMVISAVPSKATPLMFLAVVSLGAEFTVNEGVVVPLVTVRLEFAELTLVTVPTFHVLLALRSCVLPFIVIVVVLPTLPFRELVADAVVMMVPFPAPPMVSFIFAYPAGLDDKG